VTLARDCLYVCETCLRDRQPAPGEATLGRRLGDAVEAALEALPPAGRPIFRRVACLNACLSPCSIALRARGKVGLRLSRLAPADAPAVAALAELYCRSADGDPPPALWPAALHAKLSARTPAPRPLPS